MVLRIHQTRNKHKGSISTGPGSLKLAVKHPPHLPFELGHVCLPPCHADTNPGELWDKAIRTGLWPHLLLVLLLLLLEAWGHGLLVTPVVWHGRRGLRTTIFVVMVTKAGAGAVPEVLVGALIGRQL